MKISAINNRYNSYVSIQNQNTAIANPVLSRQPACDTVSFKSAALPRLFINDLREIPDLTCGCCGKKMLQNDAVNKFLNEKIYYPASIALKRKKNEKIFKESKASKEMKHAYSYLRDYSAKHPKLTMNDILTKRAVKEARRKLSPEGSEAFDEIREMTKLIAHNSKYIIDEITKLNPDFRKVEKRAFKELQWLAKKYPNETFHTILNKPEIHNHYLKNLEAKQMDILNKIEFASESLEPDVKPLVLDAIKNAKEIFKNEEPSIRHKRSRVIAEFQSAFEKSNNHASVKKIADIADSLPSSVTDVDAFMIKGSQKSTNTIVETLLGRQRNTFEHVKPHHRIGDNGPSTIYNYIGLCGKCNLERQRMSYEIFTKIHPEMVENEQLQMDKIIYFINNGILTGYDKYPQEIKKALQVESKNAINIDISRLNPEQAKLKRKLRQLLYVETKKAIDKQNKVFKFGKCYFYKKRH